ALPFGREVALRDHLGQVGGGLHVGELETARGAYTEQVRVACDQRDHPVTTAHRNHLDPHRHVVVPVGLTLPDEPLLLPGHVEHPTSACWHEGAHHVVHQRGRAGGGTHLAPGP